MAEEQIRVQVLFSEETPKGRFQDALYYTEDEYAAKNRVEIDNEKQTRIDNWLAATEPQPEPTKAEQLAAYTEQISFYESEVLRLKAEKTALETKTVRDVT